MGSLGRLLRPDGPYVLTFADFTTWDNGNNQSNPALPLLNGTGPEFVPQTDDVLEDIHVFVPVAFDHWRILYNLCLGDPFDTGSQTMTYSSMQLTADGDDGHLLTGRNDRCVSVRDNDVLQGNVPTLPARVTVPAPLTVRLARSGPEAAPTTGEVHFYIYASRP